LNVQSLSVLGGDGSDTFTVTPSATTSIFIDGGDPIGVTGDTLVLNAAGDATFVPGPESDEGGFSFAGALPVSYDHIESVSLDLGGNAFTFLGTNGDDVITVVGTGTDSYTISINDGPALAITNSGDLTIDALAGDDRIVIDVNALSLGLVTVEGGQPQAAGDRLTVSGTDAEWTPSTGILTVDAQTITVLGIESLLFDGEDASGSLTVVGSDNDEVFAHTPGAALDAGHVSVADTTAGVTQLGISYVALGLGGTVTVDGAAGADTLVANGTPSSDLFEVADTTGTVTLTSAMGVHVALQQIDVETLTLDGLEGDDIFAIFADQPYGEINVLGQGPGASDALVVFDVAGQADIFEVTPGPNSGHGTVTVNAVPVNYGGVERLLLLARGDVGDSLTINDDLADNTWTVNGGPVFGDRVQIDDRESVDFAGFDTVELVNLFGSDVFHVHPTDLVGFITSLTITGDDDDGLVIHGTTAGDTLASVPGGGAQGTASGNGVDVLFGGLASVELRGGDGDDVFNVTPIAGVNTIVTGGEPSASDTLNVTVDGSARTTQGETSTSGTVDMTGAGDIDYTGIESMSITSLGGGTLTSRATHDNDTIALQFLGGANRIWINDGTVTAFDNFQTVTLQGLFGSDTFNVHPASLVGVTTVNVEGGDPTASDTVVINGTAGQDTVNVTPTAIDAATVAGLGPVVNVSAAEHLIYSGLGGDDLLTITATVDDDTIVHTPGETADAGRLRVNSLLALDYVNLGAGGSVTVDGDAGDDRLVYLGSSQGGDFTVSAAGEVDYEDAVVHVTVGTTDVENLELDASASGTTLFSLNAGYPYDTVTLIGSNHSGSLGDVAQLNGDGTALTIAPTAVNDQIDVTGGGLGAVTLYGIENLEVDAGGGDVTYNGNAADNDVTVSPSAADAAGIAHAGLDAQINVANVASLLVDLLGGSNSLTVLGTQGDDAITVTGAQVAVNLLLPVDYLNVQSLSVLGGDGSDTFTVTPSATTSIFIDGGDPIGVTGDTLVLNAAGDATFVPGPESDEGGFSFAGALPVSYDHIESVSLDLGGNAFTFLGTNGDDVITVVGTGTDSYTISINDGPALAITNSGDLTIDALAGDDRIVIDVNALSLGLVTVEGGQPQAAGDRLTVSGTDAEWTPSTGILTVDAQTITVLGIESLLFDGEDASGSLTVVGSDNDEVFAHTPGAALDAGHVSVADTTAGVTQLGISYVALGLGGTVTVDGAAGADTLVANGTPSSDLFEVADTTGTVTLTSAMGVHVALQQIDVETLTLDGLEGDDIFAIFADQPYGEINVLGQGPGASDALVVFDVAGQADIFEVTPGPNSGHGTVTVNAVPVNYGGVERLLLLARGDVGDSLTINDDLADNTWTVNGGPVFGDRVQIDDRESVDFAGFDTVELVNLFGSDVFHVHPTDLVGFITSLTITGDDDDGLVIHGTTAGDTLASVPGGGAQGTASGNGVDVLFGGLASVELRGGDGDDVFNVTPIAGVNTIVTGGEPSASDTLNVTVDGSARTTQGETSTSGTVDMTGAGDIDYTGIESMSIGSLGGGTLTSRATHDNDTIALQFLGGANRIWINDGTVTAFDNFQTVTLQGLFGSDTFNVHPTDLVGVTTVNVEGGDPTASDTVVVNGSAGVDDITYQPTAFDAGNVAIVGSPVVNFTGTEHLTIHGLGGGDELTIDTFNIDGTQVLTPGSSFDSGRVDFRDGGFLINNAVSLDFLGLDVGGSLTFTDIGRFDNLIYRGTDLDDTFSVDAAGQVLLNTQIPVNTPSIATLTLAGLDGDDTFNIAGDHNLPGIVVEGGNPDASDVLNFTGSGAGFVTIDLEARTVTEDGFGPVTFSGVEIVNVVANADVFVDGTADDDDLSYTPTGAAAGTLVLAGLNAVFNVSAADSLTLDPLGGADRVTVHGNPADNAISVDRGATTTVQVDATLAIDLTAATEALVILAGLGDDTITVTGSGGPSLAVDGGGPTGSDTLEIIYATPGATTTVEPGSTPDSGVVRNAADGDVSFEGISLVSLTSADPDDDLVIQGTNDNDTMALQFLAGANRAWVNDRAVVAFAGYDEVTLQGRFGSDTFSVHPVGLVGVDTVNVQGGDPTASDKVTVNGSAGVDDITYEPTAFDAGNVAIVGSPVVSFTGTEHLTIHGLGGGDSLTIDTFLIDGTQVLTPGSSFDSGRVDFRDGGFATNNAVSLDFLGLDVGGSLTFIDAGRFDGLIYRGTDLDDTFSVDAAGQVLLNSQIPVNTPSIATLTLAGLDGDDTFNIAGDHNLPAIVVEGGNPSASDVLNFTGSGADVVTVDFGDQTVTETGFGPVAYSGIERINLDAGAFGPEFVATDDDDDVTVTVFGASSGTVQIGSTAQQDGQAQQLPTAPLVHYTNTDGNAVHVDLGDGEDTLIVVGNALPQAFVVDGPGETVTIDDNDDAVNDGIVTYENAESLAVYGLEGSDTFTVTGGPIPIFIDGGDPIGALPGDVLIVTNAFAFFAGPQVDEGGFLTTGGPDGIVSFDHIEFLIVAPAPVNDCPFIIFGTNADDDITVIARDDSTHPGADGVQDFTVSVNEGPEILFLNVPHLVIDALAGDDDIVIRGPAPNQAAWDMTFTIIGGPPSGITGDQGDVLMVETPGLVDVVYTPTGSDTGTMVITNTLGLVADITIQGTPFVPPPNCPQLPPPLIGGNGGIETLIYDGEGFGDNLTIVGTVDGDIMVHTPGAGVDEGHVRVNTMLGISYQNLGAGAGLTVDGDGGVDTLVVDGTGLSDTFTVAATTGSVTLANSHGTRLAVEQTNVENLALNGLEGDDTFTINAPQPYVNIGVNGGGPGASDVLVVNGAAGVDESFTVTPDFASGDGTVTVNALFIPYTGVEHIRLDANGGDTDTLTVNDDLADNLWTVNAGPIFGDRIQIDSRESIDYDDFDAVTLVNQFGADQFVIHPTHLVGTNAITVVADGGAVRDDVVTIIATEADDVVTSTADTITVNGSVPVTVGASGAGFAEVQVLALGGDDHITLSLGLPGVRKFVDGGAGNDFINMSGTDDAIILAEMATTTSSARRWPTSSTAAAATTSSSATAATTSSTAAKGTTSSSAVPAPTRCSAGRATTRSSGTPATAAI
jgi:hypothetical protein